MANHHNSEYVRLKELGKSKFEVSKNESDIRGWTVKNSQGRIMGKVSELLFDVESEKVLYMVLDLVGNEMYMKERRVLAPLSVAEINEAHNNVLFPGIMANELADLPTYEKDKVSTRIEDIVQHAFNSVSSSHTPDSHSSTERSGRNAFVSAPARDHITHAHHSSNSGYAAPTAAGNHTQSSETVIGVFENTARAEGAVEHLLRNNFNNNQIELSGRNAEHNDSSLTSWFKTVFGNDTDARTYSEAARTGAVVTVHASSLHEAELAAGILDDHGALNIKDSHDNRNHHFRSRILSRNDPGSR